MSGCQLGKAVEIKSMLEGTDALRRFLAEADALPLRDYVPWVPDAGLVAESCRGRIDRSIPDDDITYSVLALMMLEQHGAQLTTVDVARSWVGLLPIGATFTAERAAYLTLSERGNKFFAQGADLGFDPRESARNDFSDWIGAQIRADLYGWVCPGAPAMAADLAEQDAALSHTGDGIGGARFVAALGAALASADTASDAVAVAIDQVGEYPATVAAIEFGRSLIDRADPVADLQAEFEGLSPVHTLNNLAVVVWGLLRHEDDFSAAIGETVAVGWDTDCNGATVGALWGITGRPVPEHWTRPWAGTVEVSLAGVGHLQLDDLVDRTVAVAHRLREAQPS